MEKLFEIGGCIEVRPEVTEDEFLHEFIGWVESKGWSFGGGIRMIVDDYYINSDGTKGDHVLADI